MLCLFMNICECSDQAQQGSPRQLAHIRPQQQLPNLVFCANHAISRQAHNSTSAFDGGVDVSDELVIEVGVVLDAGQHIHARLKVVSKPLQCLAPTSVWHGINMLHGVHLKAPIAFRWRVV